MASNMEAVECCPVCGGEGEFVLSTKEPEFGLDLHLYGCATCKTSYHNPRMTERSMAEYYASGKYRDGPNREIDKYLDNAARRIKWTVATIEATITQPPERCLDVGCSRGYLCQALKDKYGAEVVGYDIYQDPKAVIDVLDSKDKITGKFDLVTCIHVLEHFADPMQELEWMAGLMKDDGMLMIEIPLSRVVIVPHPIIFSREAVPFLMKRIDARYIFMDMQLMDLGVILAWKNGYGPAPEWLKLQ